MVVLDTTILLPLMRPGIGIPIDPATGEPISQPKERLDYFVAQLDKARTRIGIPTPVLSEVMVRDEQIGVAIIESMKSSLRFKLLNFDAVCAVELAHITRAALNSREKRRGVKDPWQKIKLDRQIVAIAKANNAAAIYSDDPSVRTFAREIGLDNFGLIDLPLPPSDAQGSLPLETVQEVSKHGPSSENLTAGREQSSSTRDAPEAPEDAARPA